MLCVSGAPAECKQANYFFHLYLIFGSARTFIYFLALYNSLVTIRISSVSSVCIITSSGRKMLHKKIRTTKRFVLNADKTKRMILSDSITGIVFSVRLFLVRAHLTYWLTLFKNSVGSYCLHSFLLPFQKVCSEFIEKAFKFEASSFWKEQFNK